MLQDMQREHIERVQQELTNSNLQRATFGAGCFWGVEYSFARLPGVRETAVGYAGGEADYPDYKLVCSGTSGHAEVVELLFDPNEIDYQKLVHFFFEIHNPTTPNRQGYDVGSQYRSVIFAHSPEQEKIAREVVQKLTAESQFKSPIVTQIEPAPKFFRAEEYHQKYSFKNGIRCS